MMHFPAFAGASQLAGLIPTPVRTSNETSESESLDGTSTACPTEWMTPGPHSLDVDAGGFVGKLASGAIAIAVPPWSAQSMSVVTSTRI